MIVSRTNRALKTGITHYFYSYRDYMGYMGKITSEFEIERMILPLTIHQMVSHLPNPIFNLISNLYITLIGGSLELTGVKKTDYKRQNVDNRDVVPIDVQKSNVQQIKFYREKLIPEVLKVFSETHEKCKKH
jgi:hypothetical protein